MVVGLLIGLMIVVVIVVGVGVLVVWLCYGVLDFDIVLFFCGDYVLMYVI